MTREWQIALTCTCIAAMTYVTAWLNYRTASNLLWMFGLPVLVALIFNHDAQRKAFMGLVLVCLSPVAMMVTAAIFGLGP